MTSDPRSTAFAQLLPAGRCVPSPALADALHLVVDAGQTAWPDVQLEPDEFLRHLAACAPAEGDVVAWLGAMFAADLYLACACARGDTRALGYFETELVARVGEHWRGGHALAGIVDEVRQMLRERLLVAPGGQAPRIAGYTGSGPLAAWVRMTATRLAIDVRRGAGPASVSFDADALTLQSADPDPQLEYLKQRYTRDLDAALQAALLGLSPRLATILRLHYQEHMTFASLATMYSISERTAQRWVADARNTVLAETRRLLREQLRLEESQLDSLIGILRSRIGPGIAGYLERDG